MKTKHIIVNANAFELQKPLDRAKDIKHLVPTEDLSYQIVFNFKAIFKHLLLLSLRDFVVKEKTPAYIKLGSLTQALVCVQAPSLC